MKLTKTTLGILKNFSVINDSININEESVIKTISPGKNIIAVCDVEEVFPKLALYSLSNFVSVLSIFDQDKVEYNFGKDSVEISENKSKVIYKYTDEEYVAVTELKDSEVYKSKTGASSSFDLSYKDLTEIQKASKILNLKQIKIKMEDGKGTICLINSDLSSASNTFEIEISGQGSCSEIINVDNLIMYPSNYQVSIFDENAIKFKSETFPLFYFVSVL